MQQVLRRPPKDPTVAVYAAEWLRRPAGRLRANTRRLYRYGVESHVLPAYGDRRLTSITRGDIRALADALGARYAPKTVRQIISAFSAMLSAGVEDEILAANPAFRLRLPTAALHRAPAFRDAQLDLFLTATVQVEPTLAPLFYLCAHAGLRVGEAMAVRVGDANLDTRALHVQRTAHRHGETDLPKDGPRVVRLPPRLAERLRVHEATVTDWYFPGETRRGPLSYTTVRRAMIDACDVAGLEYRPTHGLRRTFISQLLATGAPPEWCRRQVGHANLATTMAYNDELPMDDPETFAAM